MDKKRFYMLAEELYDAGARLDGLNFAAVEIGSASAALVIAAEFARTGRNLFYDEKNTLTECCRWAGYEQASGLIGSALPEELTNAISELLRHGRYRTEKNLRLVERMVKRGGKIDLDLLKRLSEERKPGVFQNPPEYVTAIKEIAAVQK